MKTEKDKNGNVFFEVSNIRITCISETWNGEPGIRVQAYTGEGKKLHRGAELPVPGKDVAYSLIVAIAHALEANGV